MSEGIFTEPDEKRYTHPITPEQKQGEILAIGLRVLDAVDILKLQKNPTQAQLPIVRFCADKDYDIHLLVRLAPKKSQKQIGEEMFRG